MLVALATHFETTDIRVVETCISDQGFEDPILLRSENRPAHHPTLPHTARTNFAIIISKTSVYSQKPHLHQTCFVGSLPFPEEEENASWGIHVVVLKKPNEIRCHKHSRKSQRKTRPVLTKEQS